MFGPMLNKFRSGKYYEIHPWVLRNDGVNQTFSRFNFTDMSILTMYKALSHEGRRINILKV